MFTFLIDEERKKGEVLERFKGQRVETTENRSNTIKKEGRYEHKCWNYYL
jgi:hypothetical protein